MENQKHQRYLKIYNHYKGVILKWENNMTKLEGRKPDKHDFENAPREVKEAYKQYHKYKRSIAKLEVEQLKEQEEAAKSKTPRKIFGGFQSQSFILSKKSKDDPISTPPLKKNPIIRTFSHKLFSMPSLEPSKKKLGSKSNSNNSVGNDPNNCSNLSNTTTEKNSNNNNNIDEKKTSSTYTNIQQHDDSNPNPNGEIDNEISEAVLSFFEDQNNSMMSTTLDSSIYDECSTNMNTTTTTREDSSSCSNGGDMDMSMSTSFDNSMALDTSDIFIPSTSFVKICSNKFPSNNGSDNNFQPIKYGSLFDRQGTSSSSLGNLSISSSSKENSNDSNPRKVPTSEEASPPVEMSSFSFSDPEDNLMTDNVKLPNPNSIFDMDSETETSNIPSSSIKTTATTTTTTTSAKRTYTNAFTPSPGKAQPKKKFFKSDRKGPDKRYSLKSCLSIPLKTNKKTTRADESIGVVETDDKSLESLKTTLHPDLISPTSSKSSHDDSSPSTSTRVTRQGSKQTPTSDPAPTKRGRKATTTTKTVKKVSKVTVTVKSKSKPKTTLPKKTVTRKTSEQSTSTNTAGPSSSSSSSYAKSSFTVTSEVYDDDYTPDNADKPGKGKKGLGRKRFMTTERKIANGRIDDNFVRIDVKKKVFVRGKRKMTGQKVKQRDWKFKKSMVSRENKLADSKCRKCGEFGHFAKFCMKEAIEAGLEANQGNPQVDDSPWPTLEEATQMVWSKKAAASQDNCTSIYANCNLKVLDQDEEDFKKDDSFDAAMAAEDPETMCSSSSSSSNADVSTKPTPTPVVPVPSTAPVPPPPSLPPTFGPYCDSKTMSDEELDEILEKTVKDVFGYDGFRPGQKETIVRVLKGEPALLISSTGSGKSLCYQLPAYLYAQKYPSSLTLCVSPLVSLMDDQVEGLPDVLHGIALHCQMTAKKREQHIESIKQHKAQILLASPEAVASGLFGLLRTGELPPIAFACIDEVHCVSEWSHNFRPAYLELCKILRDKINVKCILGLTATATAQTEASICEHLYIDRTTVLRGEIVPTNLNLSVSRDQDRDLALLHLLRSKRFRDCASIIVYCTTREQCDRIAVLIRTNIQDNPEFNGIIPNGRSKVSANCEVYHARITAARRRYVQKHFMAGNIRIVVATIAFGMGIDKSDIRAVIHYNMSKTFEMYVQEIGRAGRDGLPGECHLFLDNIKGKDLSELKRHIYSNSIDRGTIRSLLRRIFRPCKCDRIEKLSSNGNNLEKPARTPGAAKRRCPGHEVAFNSEEVVKDLDIPAENISTLLCYLELDPNRKWIEIQPMTYAICKIHSYGGSKLLKEAALKCPPLAVAIALEKEKKKFKDSDVYLEFDVIEAAASVGWSSSIVKREIKNLEWTGSQFDKNGKPIKFRKSGILVEFTGLAYRVKAPGDLTDEESDQVLNYLFGINFDQERTQLYNLYKLYQSFYSVSSPNVGAACDGFNKQHSETLKNSIVEYFKQEKPGVPPSWKLPVQGLEKEDDIRRDIGSLLSSQRETFFTGRGIAKILQGIPSPNYTSEDWSRNRAFWRRYMDVDFHFISKIASEEILRYS